MMCYHFSIMSLGFMGGTTVQVKLSRQQEGDDSAGPYEYTLARKTHMVKVDAISMLGSVGQHLYELV